MKNLKIKEIIVTHEEIRRIVSDVAERINNDYKDSKRFVILCVLKGAFVFTSDLIRNLDIDCLEVNFIKASSYGDSDVSDGDVQIASVGKLNLENADVLVVEDIVDTGYTLKRLTEKLRDKKPNSVKVCSMFNKPERREVDFEADYIGTDVPNEFIVGYGLDYAERYRYLPYVASAEEF